MKSLRARLLEECKHKTAFEKAAACAHEYLDGAFARNVFPTDAAIENLARFSQDLPEGIGDAAEIINTLHQYGSPATVAQIGGRFFGFVNGGAIPAALAARWLADVWDQNAGLYVMSPVASKLEEVVEGWLRQLFGLPAATVAGFVSGTSAATFCALAAARYRVLQNRHWDVNGRGLNGAPGVRVITGRQAHATVVKAVALLGLGVDNVEWVDTDEQGRIMPAAVPRMDDGTILILQAGNVNSGAFDAFDEVCDAANEAGAWVHIDGAFGLWAAVSGELKHLTAGLEKAQSWSVDGHKTLNAPYDSGIVLCRDEPALVHALQTSGSYLSYSDKRDGMAYTSEMSRRARAVELWAALRYLGKAGVAELVYDLHRRAVQIGEALKAEGFQVVNEVVFNQTLIACDSDELTEAVVKRVQRSGECWVGGAKWFGRSVIRISVCSWATTEQDIARAVRAFTAARDEAL